MDPFLRDAIERYKRQPPGERLREALEVMRDGFALKRQNLRRRHPDASEEELERIFLEWLSAD